MFDQQTDQPLLKNADHSNKEHRLAKQWSKRLRSQRNPLKPVIAGERHFLKKETEVDNHRRETTSEILHLRCKRKVSGYLNIKRVLGFVISVY
jgi:hypothetical protein